MSLDGWSRPGSNDFYPRIASFVAQNKNGRFGGSVLDEGPEIKNVFSSLDDAREKYPTLLPLSSKLLIRNFGTSQMKVNEEIVSSSVSQISRFGEYKLSREKLDFQYCAPAGKDSAGNQIYKLTEYQDGYSRVCEVDFAVTDHYLIQNSPFGIGKNAATIDLNSYALKN